jgi:hypothetical protein
VGNVVKVRDVVELGFRLTAFAEDRSEEAHHFIELALERIVKRLALGMLAQVKPIPGFECFLVGDFHFMNEDRLAFCALRFKHICAD